MAINLNIRQASPNVGAFVDGIDLANDLDANAASQLREALGAYGVLFFRDQNLTPEQHIAAAERFGAIDVNRFFAHVDGHEKIAEVRKEPEQKANIGGGWHTDHTYDQIPAMGSMLLARETPTMGGDTLFASMYAAYDTLSDGLKATIENLNAVHSSRHVFGKSARYKSKGEDLEGRLTNPELAQQDAVHPVVIRHPISGKKALYVNPGFTLRFEGMTDAESAPLLQTIYTHCQNQAFVYRFQWAPGSIAFWDNRATWHYAVNDYQGERRLMHRITIEGEAVAA